MSEIKMIFLMTASLTKTNEKIIPGHFSLDSSDSSNSDTPETQNEVEIEMTNYRKESSLPKNENPLSYWKKKEVQYPLLAKLAKKYLCIQATSTTAERIFSRLGLLLTKRRLCLDGERSEKIMFLSDKV